MTASIELAVRAHLLVDPPLAALIGDRIDPIQLAQRATLPALTYARISRKPTQHRDNPVPTYSRVRIQFDVWAASYAQAVDVKNALVNAMGALVRTTNPRIDVSLLQDDRDALEVDTGRWRSIIDYFVWYKEN